MYVHVIMLKSNNITATMYVHVIMLKSNNSIIVQLQCMYMFNVKV